jgi:hypothetical protein
VANYLLTDPAVPRVAYRNAFGNWCSRIVAPRGDIRIFADGSTCISVADGIPSTPATTFLASGASSLHAAATLPTSRWSPPSDRASSKAFDFNVDEIASEIRTINPSLSEAIAHDIGHGGDSQVEQIDLANGNVDASEAARVILIASLSSTLGAIHGLREYQLVDCLQRPGRGLSTFKANVLDNLATRAWYLHNSADGRLFFKNQQNLAAKLRSTALSLHAETVDLMLRKHLESYFSASIRVERYCLQALDIESRGERRKGMHEELARGFGVTDIRPLLKSDKANGTRMFTPAGLAASLLAPIQGAESNPAVLPARRGRVGSGAPHPFAVSPLRHLIFAIHETAVADNSLEPGRQYLRDTFGQG